MLGPQTPNKIEPFQVDFQDSQKNNISAKEQAKKIIAEFERRLKASPTAKVAITYSANNDQVIDITKGYTTGEYSIGGSNQAQVIKRVIEEIKKRGWQDKAHILPIATSQHSGGSGVIRMDQVNRDLANIAQHLGAGWQVLGFRNQLTGSGVYAVGGGESRKIWKGELKTRFDAQMVNMTNGDFSDPILQQAYQEGQQKGVPLVAPPQLTQSTQPKTQAPHVTPTPPIVSSSPQSTQSKALENAQAVSNLMKAFKVPTDVEHLANVGNNAYQTGKVKAQSWVMRDDPMAKQNPWPLPKAGGGRQDNWVEDTFANNEAEIIEQLKSVPPPQTVTAKDIRSAYDAQNSMAENDTLPQFTIVQGVGVNDLHKTPLGQDALLQVASQFDFQESPGAYDFPVEHYLGDRTQGPQASIESASSALHRKAAKKAGTLDHALADLLPKELLDKYPGLYRHGYLEINQIKDLADKQQLLDHITNNIEKIKVLPQWTICESSGAKQMQVFCAAPSFQGGLTPKEGSIEDKICKKLVVVQYVALAQLAVIRSRETGQTVPLHLTLVGQGAFNNNPTVMKEAMAEVAKIVKGQNVVVYVHAYDQNADNILRSQMNGSYTVSTMTAETFKTQPHPSQVAKAKVDFEPTVLPQPKPQAPTNPKLGIQVRRKKAVPTEILTEPVVTTTTQSIATSTTVPIVKATSPILTAFTQDKENQFPLKLTTKLADLFQETNWKIDSPNNQVITITDKTDTTKQVQIKKEADAIRLSTIHIDDATTEALYHSTAAIEPAKDEILEFDVEMTHHYDWKEQLKKMHDKGIDIENIKSLKVDGKEMIDAAKQSIQEIKQSSRPEHTFTSQRNA